MSIVLEEHEINAFNLLGYTAPLPLADPDAAQSFLDHCDTSKPVQKNMHSTDQRLQSVLRDRNLVSAVKLYCGDDFSLWRSAQFVKTAGSEEIGWHHDKHFASIDSENICLAETQNHFSVLFGLTEITAKNGLMEVIPGSHRQIDGFHRDERRFDLRPIEDHILSDLPRKILDTARPLPIPASCFVIFHSALLHRSLPHILGETRVGLAIRLAKKGLEVPKSLANESDIIPFPPPELNDV